MSKRKSRSPEREAAEHERIAGAVAGRVKFNRDYADQRRVAEAARDNPRAVTITAAPEFRLYLGDDEIVVDNFAGGGGASTGVAMALCREPDIAINHDPEAIAMHRANHPLTEHYVEDVYQVDPVAACRGRRVALAWFSPDCKHHSKAKGGKPRDARIRGLAWVAVRWAKAVQPRVICLENVEEFLSWGPLHKRGPRKGMPIAARAGETFRAFVRRLAKLGYRVEWRLIRASDHGAPTYRRRLILVARRDGREIVWPVETHGPDRPSPHRSAGECMEWNQPIASIFGRGKPLADKTLARIARGVRKYVLEAAQPFIIPVNHGGDLRVHGIDEPLRTITAHGRGSHAIVIPYLVHRSNGERPGQAPRIYDISNPLGTIVAQGQKHALVAALLVKHYGARRATEVQASPMAAPIGTVTSRDHHSLLAVHLTKMYGTSTGADLREPAPTVTAGGQHLGLVAALLRKHGGADVGDVVTVVIDGETYAVADIFMRMLTARELYRAQGFPDTYKIDPIYNGKPLTKTAQVRMVGNSVCPPLAAAVVAAQFKEHE